MKIGEELRYHNGFCANQDNTKFWERFYRIKDTGELTGARWCGDYLVRTFICEEPFSLDDGDGIFQMDDGDGILQMYEIWENAEYGIFHSIKRIA